MSIKSLPPDDLHFNIIVLNCLRYCQIKERATKRAQLVIMDELKRTLASQSPNTLSLLLHHACHTGLSHYGQHVFNQDLEVMIKDTELVNKVLRIDEGMTPNSRYAGGYLRDPRGLPVAMAQEYVEIVKVICQYMRRDTTQWAVRRLCAIAELADHTDVLRSKAVWVDSHERFHGARVLFAAIEALFEQDDAFSEYNHIYSMKKSAEMLSTWLGGLIEQLMAHSDEDSGFNRRVENLKARQDAHWKRMEVDGWSAFLSRVEASQHQVPPDLSLGSPARLKEQKSGRFRQLLKLGRRSSTNLSTIPDGPFELHATSFIGPINRNPDAVKGLLGWNKTVAGHRVGSMPESSVSVPLATRSSTSGDQQRAWKVWLDENYHGHAVG
jgi:hypothetical protein